MKSVSGCIKIRLRFWAGVAVLLTASPFLEAAEAVPLARYFPRQDLAAYAEFDGLDAHGELWRKTAAYRLLNETPAGAMFESVFVQLAGRTRSMTPLEAGEMWLLAEHAIRHGFAVGVVRNPGPGSTAPGLGRCRDRGGEREDARGCREVDRGRTEPR